MESELLATQKMRHELEEHLSYLEKTKQRLSLLFKAREIEAVNSKKGLLDCIKTLRELEGRNSSVLHDLMRPLIREMHQLRANYKDMKKRITDAAATIESLERSNENKRTDLLITEMEGTFSEEELIDAVKKWTKMLQGIWNQALHKCLC